MSIRKWFGLPDDSPGSGDAEVLRKIAQALESMPEERARFIAAFAYVLGRVAYADRVVDELETHTMEQLVAEKTGLTEAQAVLAVQVAKSQAQLFGGTDDFVVTRTLKDSASRQQKMAILDCLFAVAASEGGVATVEDTEISQIASELGLEHAAFIEVKSRYRHELNVLRQDGDGEGS